MLTAQQANKISEENQLSIIIKHIEMAARLGKRSITKDGLYPATIEKLKELFYTITDDEEDNGKFAISW